MPAFQEMHLNGNDGELPAAFGLEVVDPYCKHTFNARYFGTFGAKRRDTKRRLNRSKFTWITFIAEHASDIAFKFYVSQKKYLKIGRKLCSKSLRQNKIGYFKE